MRRFLVVCPVALLLAIAASIVSAAPLTDEQQGWLAKGTRHEKAGWTYLHVEGSARQRGFQHGYLLANEVARQLREARVGWTYQTSMGWNWLAAKADSMFTPRIDPENLAEIDGIVEGLTAAGVPATRADLVAWNGIIELSGYWWPKELERLKAAATPPPPQERCSSFIATGSMTSDGGVVLGHNTMQGYEGAWPDVVVDIVPDHGHRILMQTLPGFIHSATDFFITDAGLVGSETTIGGFSGFDSSGVPEFSRMRRATQDADSIGAWCEIMKRGNNGGYANAWLLGDVNTGEIARLELGLKRVAFERTRDGCFVGSNVAEDLQLLRFETDFKETDIRASSVARRVRWKQLMAQYKGHIDAEAAKRFEGDHVDVYLGGTRPGNRTLCAHNELEDRPARPSQSPNEPGGTVDAKVVDARMAKRMSFAARWGSACGMAFDAPRFLQAHPQYEWMKDILRSRPAQPWVVITAGETR